MPCTSLLTVSLAAFIVQARMKRREDAKIKKMKEEKKKAKVENKITPHRILSESGLPRMFKLNGLICIFLLFLSPINCKNILKNKEKDIEYLCTKAAAVHQLVFLSSSFFNLCFQLEEAKSEPPDPAAPQVTPPPAEPKKPGRRRSAKVEAPPPVQQTDEERIAQGKRVLGARSKAKALAKAQAEAEAAAQAALAAKRAAERRAQAQRRLEERKRQQLIAEELKKPTEDMCLTDHKVSSETERFLL